MITVVKRLRSILTNYMEGNFLSRYNNKIDAWKDSMDQDPTNRSEYEREMSDYIIKCMPYMKQYTEEIDTKVSTDNVFNCKITTGLKSKDIFNEYLSDVENLNVERKITMYQDTCIICKESNIFHFHDNSE